MSAGVLGTAREREGSCPGHWTAPHTPESTAQTQAAEGLCRAAGGRVAPGWGWTRALARAPLSGGLHKLLGLSVVLPSHRSQQGLTVAASSLSECGHLAS